MRKRSISLDNSNSSEDDEQNVIHSIAQMLFKEIQENSLKNISCSGHNIIFSEDMYFIRKPEKAWHYMRKVQPTSEK